MTSYRNGVATGLTRPRLAADSVLTGRDAVASLVAKHVTSVRRYCVPIACDVDTRADLYDVDAAVRQFGSMNTQHCCITSASGEVCASPIMLHAPYPVCMIHAAVISEFFAKQDKLTLARAAAFAAQAEAPAVRLPTGEPRSSVVYYVQVDAVMKIGTTIDMAARMATYPPYARLLVTEPGGYTLERKRHRQFNEYLRAGNEWFNIGPRLRKHVEQLMADAEVAV